MCIGCVAGSLLYVFLVAGWWQLFQPFFKSRFPASDDELDAAAGVGKSHDTRKKKRK